MTQAVRRALQLAAGILVALPGTADAQSAWRLQLDHAIRPEEGSAGMIGDVVSLAVSRSGVVYVAERDAGQVTRYAASGAFAGIFMRHGSGPGEVRHPAIALQGDTLVVYDSEQDRLVRMAPNGRVLNQWNIDVAWSDPPIFAARDGTILVSATDSAHGLNRSAWRVPPTGRIDKLAWSQRDDDDQYVSWRKPGVFVSGGPFSARVNAQIDQDGHVVVGGTRKSEWFVISERDTLRRVTLVDHAITIPVAVRDSAWSAFVKRYRGTPFEPVLNKDLLPKTLPAWVTFNIDPSGAWWIGRPGSNGKVAGWDVVVNGEVVAHLPTPARVTGPMAFGPGWIALVHEDENDVPWIGVYRVVRDNRRP